MKSEKMAAALEGTKDAIFGDGTFAVFVIDDLERTVQGVAAQGKVDDAMFCLGDALNDGDISFLDSTVYKLLLQQTVGFHRLRNDDQS